MFLCDALLSSAARRRAKHTVWFAVECFIVVLLFTLKMVLLIALMIYLCCSLAVETVNMSLAWQHVDGRCSLRMILSEN